MDLAPYDWPSVPKLNSGNMKDIMLITGPCSAETRQQVLAAAEGVAATGPDYFRAGIWKPRTQPGAFEGVGSEGLQWLSEVKSEFGLRTCTEVANGEHVELALKAGVDMLWVGARTTANPFQVQHLADSLSGVDVPVAVKNPIHPDLALWSGAVERLARSGVREILAIHRGFSVHGQDKFRNAPLWQIPIDFRNEHPGMPMINDPSHICGKRALIPDIAQMAMDLAFDGLMIESHHEPDNAWTDAAQQLTPSDLKDLLERLVLRKEELGGQWDDLEALRAELSMVDDSLIDLLARRMRISESIGSCKKERGLTILQNQRWLEMFQANVAKGKVRGMDERFLSEVFKAIHQASIRTQEQVMQESRREA